jgi:predicted ABC-type ATPase
MLNRINELLYENKSFAFETTLSTRSYKHKILKAKEQGYSVTLLFFWLENVELAKIRVKTRVKEGGHNIPKNVIERRYLKGIKNLFDIYIEIVDVTLIFDNSYGKHQLIAQKFENETITILDSDKFNRLKNYYDKKR